MEHRLVGHTVECRDFIGELFIIEKYDPETGRMVISNESGTHEVHVSACKVVKEKEEV